MSVEGSHPLNTNISRPLKPGIYAPVPSFFLPETEDLDLTTFEIHVARVAKAGMSPLVAGSMGEAVHLSHTERTTLIRLARNTLDSAGLYHIPVIAGTGAASTRETIELTKEASKAGADYAIVIAGGYYGGVLSNDRAALKGFFRDVSQKSPIPIMIYNYPSSAGNIDLDSDIIVELAQECPNTCGVKLTCGNVGKLTRIAGVVSSPAFTDSYPRINPQAPFLVLGGFADFLLPSAFSNGHGAITGLANIAPHAIAELFKLSQAAKKDSSILYEAQRLQAIIAQADYTIAKASIVSTKYLLEKLYGYGGVPRKPLVAMEAEAGQALLGHPHTQALILLEQEFAAKSE